MAPDEIMTGEIANRSRNASSGPKFPSAVQILVHREDLPRTTFRRTSAGQGSIILHLSADSSRS